MSLKIVFLDRDEITSRIVIFILTSASHIVILGVGMYTTTSKKIRAVMVLKQISGADIARTQNLTRGAIHHIVHGRNKTPALRELISELLGLPDGIWKDLDAELRATQEEKRR